MAVKMLGYIVSDEQLLDWGKEMKLGTDESENAKENTIVEAATYLFVLGGLFGHGRLVGVSVNGKQRTCLAVACNDPDERFPMPARRKLDKFKEVLNTDLEPRWYKYA
ncbi:hypothetical protein FPV67DRAFT_1653286 [Lyophyllum atratum]|nr:hypothetical protein FPV67DRAFT_1653286 [Lyophyllum atratum]